MRIPGISQAAKNVSDAGELTRFYIPLILISVPAVGLLLGESPYLFIFFQAILLAIALSAMIPNCFRTRSFSGIATVMALLAILSVYIASLLIGELAIFGFRNMLAGEAPTAEFTLIVALLAILDMPYAKALVQDFRDLAPTTRFLAVASAYFLFSSRVIVGLPSPTTLIPFVLLSLAYARTFSNSRSTLARFRRKPTRSTESSGMRILRGASPFSLSFRYLSQAYRALEDGEPEAAIVLVDEAVNEALIAHFGTAVKLSEALSDLVAKKVMPERVARNIRKIRFLRNRLRHGPPEERPKITMLVAERAYKEATRFIRMLHSTYTI